ncbi:DNA topoisomerase 3 [Enterococcus gallinarum]|uniref:DNA topoisomerase n=1 Tax=Enterococcus gallinarum TaxID=1353 RepID=A0A376GWW1_ENTGA|nr:DNA topoisomerase 3 [Enterococcus gallinarum]OJG45317.1 DNA topoisomerase III [Enterococcus gallinarum]STD72845.1 DNA topoisomerase III, bacteria and conjugative plasmid [Enterococcus gallinarum]STD82526.1 DNA topoisomerase III, bacteria and conjugative plasmid [Enterococcus gallinarum]
MITVILAEKPSQALAYARAFSSYTKEDGYFRVKDSIFHDETFITFGFGHLVELDSPDKYKEEWKKWALETLPIFPERYQFSVPEDKQKQFTIVAGLLQKASTIIIATDSDREGENIAWSIIHHAKAYTPDKVYKRLWINSLEKEAIRDGFTHLREGKDYLPYYEEAQTRQISDWLVGMNASPLYSLLLQEKGVSGTFSLGRVQTPTLYMIYQRQLQIDQFKKEPFFELEGTVLHPEQSFKVTLEPSQRFKAKEEVFSFTKEKNVVIGEQEATVQSVEKEKKRSTSPALFSLSSLQSKANQQFKASANDTLKAVQKLYEAQLLTYPRTDTPYITENEFDYLKNHVEKYCSFLSVDLPLTQLEPRKRYVNNKKVQEHHAIILTKQVPTNEQFQNLSSLEQNIYLLVARTTVAMFLSDYEYEETIVKVSVGELLFQAKGQEPTVQGWKGIFQHKKEDTKTDTKEEIVIQTKLPKIVSNETVTLSISVVEKETIPPKPYTEGTLITAMKTAGKTVADENEQEILKEVEGIGTEATRASIIEALKSKRYIELRKNKLFMTTKGKVLCQAVSGEKLFTSAEMTAKWEEQLKRIGQREVTQEHFLTNIKKFLVHLIEEVPSFVSELDLTTYQEEHSEEQKAVNVGSCPKCEGVLIERKDFYGCSNYPTCRYTLTNNFRHKKLTKKNIQELIAGKETIVTGIKTKEKKTYDAIVCQNGNGYLEFVSFAQTKKKSTKKGK